jgi:hypothetical protein
MTTGSDTTSDGGYWLRHFEISGTAAIRASRVTDLIRNFRMALLRCIFTVTSLIAPVTLQSSQSSKS